MDPLKQLQHIGERTATNTARDATRNIVKGAPVDRADIPKAGNAHYYGDKKDTPVMKRPIHEKNESWAEYRAELQRYEKNLNQRIQESEDPKSAKSLRQERDLTVMEMKKVAERQKAEAQDKRKDRPGEVEKVGGQIRRGLEREAEREINKAIRGIFR